MSDQDSQLSEALQEITTDAISKGMPEKHIPISVIIAIVSTLIQIYNACNKRRVASLLKQAHKHPHGLAAIRVHASLKKAFPPDLFVPEVINQFIEAAALRTAEPDTGDQ